MRWGRKTVGPSIGDARHRARFLLLPKCVEYQWRWLERARWIETFKRIETRGRVVCWGWIASRWLHDA